MSVGTNKVVQNTGCSISTYLPVAKAIPDTLQLRNTPAAGQGSAVLSELVTCTSKASEKPKC